jgi:serine kinase of HPr protein (carbohydrate metabolism regulator)
MMTIKQLTELLPIEVLTKNADLDTAIESAYSSDLLSQVLAKACHRDVWITVQTHATILGIASIKQIPCILFTEGLRPCAEVITKAEQESIILLACQTTSFQVGGEIYKLLTKEEGA